ncbi:hypothetical protein AA0229_0710 [Gluconobacter cerinus NRIC 0229]|nr:hypothetical protein AA0229_0710 [Gluconobacter cerinus NRIC 0229]
MASVRCLDQDVHSLTHKFFKKRIPVCLANSSKLGCSGLTFSVRHRGHSGGRCAGAFAVGKDMQKRDSLLFDEGECFVEKRVCFCREARYEICTNTNIGA